tara:strand:+ start:138 stop:482 length:345 start_codon:yes stop_codon:yes gene_type:complete
MTDSSFFKSEQVQENLNDIFNTYHAIAAATSELPKLDTEGKIAHIDKCKGLIDKQKTFYMRLCLASTAGDLEAADMKTRINALSQAFGYTDLAACMDAMIVTLDKAAEKELDSL